MRKPRYLYPIVLVAASLLAAFLLGEIGLRVAGIGYRRSPHESHSVLHHVHPRNVIFKTHSPWGYYEDHLVRYDEDGCVANPDASAAPRADSAATYRVAFMGDSYVAAVELPYAETFVARLEHSAGARTVIRNYGVASYSPMLYVLQWQEQVSKFQPTHVFLLLCANDVGNDEEYLRRAVFADDGTLRAVPGPHTSFFVRLFARSYVLRLVRKVQLQLQWRRARGEGEESEVVERFVEENPGITAVTARYVKELARTVEAGGATFTLMVVPSRYRLRHPNEVPGTPEFSDRWRAWAAAEGVAFFDLVPPFREAASRGADEFLGGDVHFSREGHEVVADALRNAYPRLFGDKPPAGVPNARFQSAN